MTCGVSVLMGAVISSNSTKEGDSKLDIISTIIYELSRSQHVLCALTFCSNKGIALEMSAVHLK